jgi:hypothetical protein
VTDATTVAERRYVKRPSAHPTILGLFSLAQRHKLVQNGKPAQTFDLLLTDLQRQVLLHLGVSEQAFQR